MSDKLVSVRPCIIIERIFLLSALQAYKDLDVNLIFHDAVRPLVNENIITKCVNGLKKHNAVDIVIVATDTIIQVKDNFIESIPDRDELRISQTPQAFRLSTIKKAHELGLKILVLKINHAT